MIPPSDKQADYCLLFVEDDPLAREHIHRAISYRFPGLTMLLAENGRVGLETYLERRPDIVLTDIKMPEMDGMAMAVKIKQLKPDALITVISAFCDLDGYLELGSKIGIGDWIPKPVDLKRLFASIESSVAKLDGEAR